MSDKLLTEHHLEFLSLKGGCTGYCLKSCVTAQMIRKYCIKPDRRIHLYTKNLISDGTGMLLLKFVTILKDVEALCKGKNHVFWLLENTGSMLTDFKQIICTLLGVSSLINLLV